MTDGGEGSKMRRNCARYSVSPPVSFPPTLRVPGLASDHVEVSGTGEPDDGGWGPWGVEGGIASFLRLTPAPPRPLDCNGEHAGPGPDWGFAPPEPPSRGTSAQPRELLFMTGTN